MIQSFGIFFTVNMLVYYFLMMIILYLFNDLIFLGQQIFIFIKQNYCN